jgi:hypothetical protein
MASSRGVHPAPFLYLPAIFARFIEVRRRTFRNPPKVKVDSLTASVINAGRRECPDAFWATTRLTTRALTPSGGFREYAISSFDAL